MFTEQLWHAAQFKTLVCLDSKEIALNKLSPMQSSSQPQYVHLYFGWYKGACMLLFTAIVRVLEQDMGYSSIQLC